eukprot:5556279-Amphidinium_carterae.1
MLGKLPLRQVLPPWDSVEGDDEAAEESEKLLTTLGPCSWWCSSIVVRALGRPAPVTDLSNLRDERSCTLQLTEQQARFLELDTEPREHMEEYCYDVAEMAHPTTRRVRRAIVRFGKDPSFSVHVQSTLDDEGIQANISSHPPAPQVTNKKEHQT